MNINKYLLVFLIAISVLLLNSVLKVVAFTGPTEPPPSSEAGQALYQEYGKIGIGTRPTETLDVNGNVRASGSFIGAYSGSLSAANVTGPAAFGINYGTYNYAFPAALAVGTTTTSGLPTNGLYVAGNVGIGDDESKF